MSFSDELLKAKQEQKEKEKQEAYLKYQAKHKAKAEERARVNEILQILNQYPTLAKKVGKKTHSLLCYDGITGLLNKTVKSIKKNGWYIGSINYPKAKIEEINTALKNRGVKHVTVSLDSDGHSCYIDENGQCWICTRYYDGRASDMFFPMDKEEMAKGLWNNLLSRYDFWRMACPGNWQQNKKYEEKYNYAIPDEQRVEEYFKLNLLDPYW